MKTLKDFLIWYNNKDVAPFLLALERQMEFYQSLGLDMLKDAISVPGLTLKYLFKSLPSQVYFSLIHEKHKDLYELLRQQMVGGPSIIFHRYHEKGVTTLREPNGKTAAKLVGFDANALYLWSLMQEMPTDYPTRRRKENEFKVGKKKMKTTTVRCHESGWNGPCTHKTSNFNTNSTVDATYQWTAGIPSTKLPTSFMGVYGTGTHATRPEERLSTRSMENH